MIFHKIDTDTVVHCLRIQSEIAVRQGGIIDDAGDDVSHCRGACDHTSQIAMSP